MNYFNTKSSQINFDLDRILFNKVLKMKNSLCFSIAILIAISTVRTDDVPQYPVYTRTKTITDNKVKIKGTLNQTELVIYDFELEWDEFALDILIYLSQKRIRMNNFW